MRTFVLEKFFARITGTIHPVNVRYVIKFPNGYEEYKLYGMDINNSIEEVLKFTARLVNADESDYLGCRKAYETERTLQKNS